MSAEPSRSKLSSLIVYDGDCLFCQNYVRFLKLRQSVGAVELLDARSGDPRAAALQREGFDLDEGMVFVHAGRVYHGPEAVQALALLSSGSTLFNRLNSRLLSNPAMARAFYPWLKAGRRATLWLRGRGPIPKDLAGTDARNSTGGMR